MGHAADGTHHRDALPLLQHALDGSHLHHFVMSLSVPFRVQFSSDSFLSKILLLHVVAKRGRSHFYKFTTPGVTSNRSTIIGKLRLAPPPLYDNQDDPHTAQAFSYQ